MLDTIFGQKKEMTQRYDRAGVRWPVTVVAAKGCVVTQVKRPETDGYFGVQLGFGEKKMKNITLPIQGHLRKAGAKLEKKAPGYFGEVKVGNEEAISDVKVGETIAAGQVLTAGDRVQVTGISKGKGFAGVVKRHGFAGGPRTHGQSDRLRAPGSIGSGTSPGRVWPGTRMGGHMGQEQVTVKNLTVLRVDDEAGEVWLSGAVPGARGTWLSIKKIGKVREFHPILEPGESLVVKEAAEEQAKMEESLGPADSAGKQEGEETESGAKKPGPKEEAKEEEK